jgi:ABC-type lipoprotein release transport system permease subunit
MKNLNKTEYGIPDWPEFNEYSDGYTVEGFCRDLFDENLLWIIAMFCFFGGIMLAGFAHEVVTDMPTQVTLFSVMVSLTVSVATGVLFGSFPAWKAANLSPMEALRHE